MERERVPRGRGRHGEFGDHGPACADDRAGEVEILRRMQFRESPAQHGDRLAAGVDRGLMHDGVDPDGQAAHGGPAAVRRRFGQMPRHPRPVVRGVARAHDGNGANGEVGRQGAAQIDAQRGVAELPQVGGIFVVGPAEDGHAAVPGDFEFAGQVGVLAPVQDAVGQPLADPPDAGQ